MSATDTPPTHSHFNWTTKRFEDPQLERQRYFLEIPTEDFHMDFTIFNGPPLGLSPDDRQRAQDLIALAKPILQQYTLPSLTSRAHCMQQPLILPVVLSYLRLRRMHIEAWAKGQHAHIAAEISHQYSLGQPPPHPEFYRVPPAEQEALLKKAVKEAKHKKPPRFPNPPSGEGRQNRPSQERQPGQPRNPTPRQQAPQDGHQVMAAQIQQLARLNAQPGGSAATATAPTAATTRHCLYCSRDGHTSDACRQWAKARREGKATAE